MVVLRHRQYGSIWRVAPHRIQGSGMSVNENMVFFPEAEEFDYGKAEFIAREVALGAGVSELHQDHPDRCPSPIVVNRWRRQIPAFDLLMGEAEQAKAERLADEVITIADNDELLSAQAGNAIKARQWLAGKLHERFGNAPKGESVGPQTVNNILMLSDEQLMAIASQGRTIDGESEVVEKKKELAGPKVVDVADESEADAEDSGWDFL